jgi:undecaprenyl diphosphate synthase
MGVFEKAFDEFSTELPRLKREGIRIRFVGDRKRLVPHLMKKMQELEVATAGGTGTVALAVSYGGRPDIVQAARQLCAEGAEITEETIREHLWTSDIPDPDLIIRPGGERRLSNFLLWGSAYSELAFSDTLWPDFTPAELERHFADYTERERRHGV